MTKDLIMPMPHRKTNSLETLRCKIDRIDDQLLGALARRACVVEEIAQWKVIHGHPLFDPGREARLLRRIEGKTSVLSRRARKKIFRAIVQECRVHELEKTKVLEERRTRKKTSTPKETVAIIGCGLIGTSFALALRNSGSTARIIGYDRTRPRFPRGATPHGAIDRFTTRPKEALDADLIVLAMPVKDILKFLRENASLFRSGSLVIDVGSTKRSICEAAWRYLPPSVHFIGGHPLAGKEKSGAQYADAALFAGRPFILVPKPSGGRNRTPVGQLRRARRIVRDLGALPLIATAEEHDRVLAVTSHLPQMLSIALALAASELLRKKRVIHGPAFLEMTRLAGSDYRMWSDIVASNGDFLKGSIRSCQKQLNEILSKLNTPLLEKKFQLARKFRESLSKGEKKSC